MRENLDRWRRSQCKQNGGENQAESVLYGTLIKQREHGLLPKIAGVEE